MNRIAKFEKVSFQEYAVACRKCAADKDFSEEYLRNEWENIKLPARATSGSAGYDFFMPFKLKILNGNSVFFPTGIRCMIDEGWFLSLVPKSGLGTKHGTRLLNTFGVVDRDFSFSDNEGHIMCGMTVGKDLILEAGMKYMQGIFLPYGITKDDETDTIRNGGFGSTGV